MTWTAVAKKDVQDSIRSYWLWILTVVFAVFFTASVYFFANPIGRELNQGGNGPQITSDQFVQLLMLTTQLFIPVIAIVIAYAAITGERSSGTLKLLLSLPHSRRDVMIGKLLGRGSVVVVPVVVGLLLGGIAFLATPVPLELTNYLLFAGLTALLGLVFVGIAVGISAGASSNRRSMIGSVGLYVLFSLFWDRFAVNLTALLDDLVGISRDHQLLMEVLVKHLNPITAYKSLAYRVTIAGPMQARSIAIPRNLQRSGDVGYLLFNVFRTEVPWYLTDAMVMVYLLTWLVVPIVLGYLAFQKADL